MNPENEESRALFLVPVVPVVPVVPGTERTTGTERTGNSTHSIDFSDSSFLAGKSQTDKFRYTLYTHPEGISDKDADAALGADDLARVYRQRLVKLVMAVGADKPQKYTLNDLGRAEVEREYLEYHRQQTEMRTRALATQDRNEALEMRRMELPDQIQTFRDFLETNDAVLAQLYERVRRGESWLEVSFGDLARHSPELADLLLDQPEDLLKAFQIAIDKMDLAPLSDVPVKIEVRITGLPDSQTRSIGDVLAVDKNRLVCLVGQVVVAGGARMMILLARFECKSCGNIIPVLQPGDKFIEPTRCGCGRKGAFKVLDQTVVDAADLLLQQPIVETAGSGTMPRTIPVLLTRDLAHKRVTSLLGLNRMVRVVGWLEETPVLLRTGGLSTRLDWRFRANSITILENYDPKLRLPPERVEMIRSEAERPDWKERLRESYFPTHVGDVALKELLVAQSVAMPLHLNTPEARSQADQEALHVLVMSPPGMGKSRNFASRIHDLVPVKGRASGPGASRAGLTIGADQKDKTTDLVIPTPQALPLANLGVFSFDELDKMELTEQTVLNEALSEHAVTVTKRSANITLPTMICLLALANPKRYDWDLGLEALEEVLNIHYTILTRCVVKIIKDVCDSRRDEQVALAILRRNQDTPRAYDDDFLRDFILLARSTVTPSMTPDQEIRIARFYAALRQQQTKNRVIPRFVEQARTLILLHAKLHLRNVVTDDDIRWANGILVQVLTDIGFDPGRLSSSIPRIEEVN